MTPDTALTELRTALAQRGITTVDSDVVETRAGYATLSLTRGLLIWCGPEMFRWPDVTGSRWEFHPVEDPAGAALRLADMPPPCADQPYVPAVAP
ncbi:hypothetical protein [Planobispora longispora]|uniref:Uncharacterized protein n=1 Tax=Planobispora longispora TaxID=28887 RepID=A0A8J3W522_9ACTN|nr:hypothetical protein [Planobispora longispora]BFE85858.1 hypothetical protein GCM10020093_084590 [Planobispora longispora]GIH76115.1 hypothetical protein Plo01_25440 [Planobispora longispora]